MANNESKRDRRRREEAEKAASNQVAVAAETSNQNEVEKMADSTTANTDDLDTSAVSDVETNGVEPEIDEPRKAGEDEIFERSHIDILDTSDERVPEAIKNRFTDADRDEIRAMVASGEITREVRVLEVRSKKTGTGQDEQQPYWAYYPETAAACEVLSSHRVRRARSFDDKPRNETEQAAKEEMERRGMCDMFFYGYDLEIRNPLRTWFMSELAGPVAAIAKQIAGMIRGGTAADVEEGFYMIEMKAKRRGVPLPDGVTLERINGVIKLPKK